MKISEMTLEQLQDYAVQLEEDKKVLQEENQTLTAEKATLDDLNKQLQKRNNDLFLKVEQNVAPPSEQKEEKPVESCEDFARKLILGE